MSNPQPPHPLHALYVEHHGWLRLWLQRRLRCPHQAADLAHDTFLRLLPKAQTLRIEEPRAFLTTLAQRVLYSFWRRRELEQAYLQALAVSCSDEMACSAETLAAVREALAVLDQHLGALPPKVRQAFLLSRLEGLTYPDIARHMGMSLATIERYMRQALLHLALQEAQVVP
ncbi:sigma-70 family RNA polymerase sigma factor [Pseudorhodoferax sp. Leaf274]|uniref:sigma-70 family RNA polymerase sigma factor n=1 Tax=Pseudorhodoferax sp. Leaf274 TaxID=1736318 RepID=UPI0007035BD6|nr:sigma-70 family RNA polymerase sigma factor [Pseudorhodoferax sp. Leaf274]KQP38952.1 RNA polymerase subunit sigma [Pseudorhodoferax sp. Leaf274]